MDMVRVFFPASREAACVRRYFSRPPLGYALIGLGNVGYFVALEWVGKLLCAPCTAPFFLGGAEHSAAAAGLPEPPFEPPVELPEGLVWCTPPPDAQHHKAVFWSVSAGTFRKVVSSSARTAAGFAAMYRAYARLAELPAVDAERPPAIVAPARLLFGAHEVLVEMRAVGGAQAADAALLEPGAVQEAVAAAVAWLALRCGVVYTDLRGPNVLVEGERVSLVDYDDCEVVAPGAIRDVEAFRSALRASLAAASQSSFASRFAAGIRAVPLFEALAGALARAFSRLLQGGGGEGAESGRE